jgi:dinuclear metal center YbgI/SA1388 family protein
MENLFKIKEFLDNYLDILNYDDASYNSLQIEGKKDIKKILFTTDFSIEAIKYSIKYSYDMVIVHHGQFWKAISPAITGFTKERIKLMLEHNISLYACHLPLDAHNECGNNAMLLKILNARIISNFIKYNNKTISFIGELDKETPYQEIIKTIKQKIHQNIINLNFGKDTIKTIAVCSGAGGISSFNEVLNTKIPIDLYISGEATEIYHLAKENKQNVIFATHHGTEILGIKELSYIVENKFKVICDFVDFPTGL